MPSALFFATRPEANADKSNSAQRSHGFKVVSSEFYFHKPITVHIELYLFYRFIHFLLYIGQY